MKLLLLICLLFVPIIGFAQEKYFEADYGATSHGYAIHLKARNKKEFEKEKERCRVWALSNGRSKQQFEIDAELMDLDFAEWCKRNGIDDNGFHGTSSSEQRLEALKNKVKENNSMVRDFDYGGGWDIHNSQTVIHMKDREDAGSITAVPPRQKTFKDVPRPASLQQNKNVTKEDPQGDDLSIRMQKALQRKKELDEKAKIKINWDE